MDELSAQAIADILGGNTWNSGGELWLVILNRSDGRVVVVSDESVNVYENEEELQGGKPIESILLV